VMGKKQLLISLTDLRICTRCDMFINTHPISERFIKLHLLVHVYYICQFSESAIVLSVLQNSSSLPSIENTI